MCPALARAARSPVLLALLLLAALAPMDAHAQRGAWEAAAGPGWIVHHDEGGGAGHLLVRRWLVSLDSIRIPPSPEADGLLVPQLEVYAQALLQRGRGGEHTGVCTADPDLLCSRRVDPISLFGLALVGRWMITSPDRPVRLYLVPAGAGLYLRSARETVRPVPPDLCERRPALCGSSLPFLREPDRSLHPGVGVVTGLGVGARVFGREWLLEVQAHLIRDLDGGEGGTVPLSLGVRL